MRVLWLLEELDLAYEVVRYQRDPETRLAPPELKEIHPLGKSPVIEDGGRVISESGAILDYLVRRKGGGRLTPDPSTPEYDEYVEWLHYAEGSAMLPVMLTLYVSRLGEAGKPLHPRINSQYANHLDYIARALQNHAYLVGNTFTAADIQMTFVLEAARLQARLGEYPALEDYLDRMHERPAFGRAMERSGDSSPL